MANATVVKMTPMEKYESELVENVVKVNRDLGLI